MSTPSTINVPQSEVAIGATITSFEVPPGATALALLVTGGDIGIEFGSTDRAGATPSGTNYHPQLDTERAVWKLAASRTFVHVYSTAGTPVASVCFTVEGGF